MTARSHRKGGSVHSGLRIRPKLEALETREVPALLLGLTAANTIVRFDSATPGSLIGAPVPITTGLQAGESLLAIDFRPSTGGLYALGSSSRLYTLDLTTGAATQVGTGQFSTLLSGTNFGFDVNPVADAIRVVSSTGQNLAINATTGAVTNQTALAYDPADPANTGFFPGTPFPAATIVSAAYTQATLGTPNVTTLYGIDSTQDVLVQIGSPDGTPNGPGTGKVVVVGELRDAAFNLINFSPAAGLDIEKTSDRAYASDGTKIYEIRITDGTVLSAATVGGGLSLTDLALAPYPVGPSSITLAAGSFTFPANRGPVAVNVTRSGGTASSVTVDYSTADGTAVAGADYFPASGTLTFAPGETTRTIFVQIPPGTAPTGPAKSFTLNLTNPMGGASLGGTTSATLTIPAVTAAPTRFFATGASQNAQVTVYDTNGGAPLFTFRAFEGNFRGEAHVAIGDVNGDGFDDVIVTAGPGGLSRVQVFDGRTLTSTNQSQLASFLAFDAGFIGGTSVASGDVNGDGFDDVIVGAGPGAGAHVKVFDGRALVSGQVLELASFLAYTGFNGGVTVSSGNFNGDKFDDVITGAGAGGGPHVKVFDGATIGGVRTELASFFAFDPGYLQGISVAGGDLNGDSIDDVIVSAKTGRGHVKVFDGRSLRTGGISELASYFAFDAGFLGGVNVGASDLNRDGSDDVLIGAGPGGSSHVEEFDGRSLVGGTQRLLGNFFAYDSSFTGGVFVG